MNWSEPINNEEDMVDKYNFKENLSIRCFDYKIGDDIFLYSIKHNSDGNWTLQKLSQGPLETKQVHINGTVSYLCKKCMERLDTRQICPLFTP